MLLFQHFVSGCVLLSYVCRPCMKAYVYINLSAIEVLAKITRFLCVIVVLEYEPKPIKIFALLFMVLALTSSACW